jgi:ABC-type antimicrobial peptide transport system permease subunit
MALGARRADVLRMIFGQVLRILTVGMVIAIPAVFVCGKLLAGMLFGVSVMDPAAIAIAAFTLGAVAAIAGFIPARRASRVDPMVALRCD